MNVGQDHDDFTPQWSCHPHKVAARPRLLEPKVRNLRDQVILFYDRTLFGDLCFNQGEACGYTRLKQLRKLASLSQWEEEEKVVM